MRSIKIIEGILLPLFILTACSENKKSESYVAKVNDSYLTESEFAALVDSQSLSDESQSVIIKNWIRQEILYKEAIKEGLTESSRYKETLELTKKQLASALILEKIASNFKPQFTEEDLVNYFEENQSSFKLPFDAYFINRINFSDRDSAVKFRSDVIMTGWEDARKKSEYNPKVINTENALLVSEQDIQPISLLRILEGLYPLEISIVIPDERDYYSVVQLIDKYSAGSIPDFQAVKSEAERRLTAALTEIAVENYVNELYSLSEIEIKND
ncbi:MAG: hypothetical protein ACHQLA_04960 [Ignavibacteriales bacterium]